MKYPERIRTGFGTKTILFPTETYVGHPDHYQFNSVMSKHYVFLKETLAQAGLELTLLGVHQYAGRAGHVARYSNPSASATLTKFVAIAGDPFKPDFIWHRNDGKTAGGATNKVYCSGQEKYLSELIRMDEFMRVMFCMKTRQPA